MAVTGRGVVSRVAGRPALVEEMMIEDPDAGEVLVRLKAGGVCHTDLHVKLGTGDGFPFLLRHEGAGVVEKVGPGVNYSFEAVSRPETLLQALRCRHLAGTCLLIGVPGPGPVLNLPL